MDMDKAKWRGNWQVERVPETGSTNADLLAGVSLEVPHRYVLTTAFQSAGKGRLGRVWEAPSGANLLVSVLLRNVAGPLHRVTQHLGLAAALVLQEKYGLRAGVKWPNDVVVTLSREGSDVDVKIAGILAQAVGNNVVVGMGLNVQWAPPPEVADATCMAALLNEAEVPEPIDMLDMVLARFDDIGALDERESFALYRKHLHTLGKQVRCEMPDGSQVVGRAVDVGVDGRLNVLDECAVTHHIDTADVMHLRLV
jgi:BirA family biotin operon repressor/biotin-[acetyl-CoA-carboxylase] ligase